MTTPPNHTSAGRFLRIGGSWPAIALAFALAGCGGDFKAYSGPVYPVTGKVLLADGKPLKSGRVIFMPSALGAMPATGDIGADGTFSLKAGDGREGAAPGTYRVRIEPDPNTMVKKGKLKVPPFPEIFANEDGATGLTATVKSEATQLEPFKLVVQKPDVKTTPAL